MNFFYDHQTFSLQNYGGISRYFSELICGINASTAHTAYLSVRYTDNVYAHELGLVSKSFLPDVDFPKRMPIVYRINKLFSTCDLLTRSCDVVHATYYDPYFLRFTSRKPTVVTFLDMTHERLGAQFKELAADRSITARKREVAKRATQIIAISESTKQDIVNLFGVDPDKIKVVYLGNSLKSVDPSDTTIPNVSSPYILYVGNRGYYKNFTLFLTAVVPILRSNGLRLVCAGGGEFTKKEIELINYLGVTAFVEQLPINDQSLRKLYTKATLFAFPSLYEGFGIPVLEAFSCNCPCVLSNQSSLPEVAGGAAVYFDPTDIDSIRTSITRVIDDKVLRMALIELGRQQVTKFSWQRTVEETVILYESL